MKQQSWNRTIWEAELSKLKPGRTVADVAAEFGLKTDITRLWIKRFKYPFKDARPEACAAVGRARRKLPLDLDWRHTDAVIAKLYNVSRQCVHQARAKEGMAKVNGRK